MRRATSSPIMAPMRALTCVLILITVLLPACSSPAPKAEVDPLTGRWEGEWGPSPDRQTNVVLELNWNGTMLTGTVNPGGRAMELGKSSFNPTTNAISMELDARDVSGEPDHYSIQGKVEGKEMSGTWTRNKGAGTFKITKE
jgi:hypothetical protein